MEGPATWGQLTFLISIVVGMAVAVFGGTWRLQELRHRDREASANRFSEEIKTLHGVVSMIRDGMDARLKSLELANAGTLVVLEHMKEFREQVLLKLETVGDDYKEEVELIHNRLKDLDMRPTRPLRKK